MPFPILAAASAGSAFLNKLDASATAPATDTMPGVTQQQKLAFKKLLMQAQGQQAGETKLQDLLGKFGPELQAKIKGMTPEQLSAFAQQLFGASVKVTDSTGQLIEGNVTGVQTEGSMPKIEVAGINYSLDQLHSVVQTGAIYQS
jgi:hypothetical protein